MKGQITVYMMIGIIILLSLGVMSYIYNSTAKQESSQDVGKSLLAVYQGQKQTQDLVQTCLSQIVREGISIMRLQGGFINIPSEFKTLPLFSDYEIYTETIDGVAHKHIREKPNSIIFVPYYITADEGIMIPPLGMLENEMKTYVETELKTCVNGLQPIQDELKIDIRDGSVEADVKFGKSIVVTGKYDIKGKTDRLEWVAKDFAYEIPVDMKKMHNYSLYLAFAENYDMYLEDHIKKVILLNKYSGKGPKSEYDLPPFSEPIYSIDPSYVTWGVEEVKQDVKTLLSETFPMLQIAYTKYDRSEFDDQVLQGTSDSFIKTYFPEDNLTRIYHNYDSSWPSEIDINPQDGGRLKPFVALGLDADWIPKIPMPNMIDYTFKYDVKIPVLVTVHDYWSVNINASNLNVQDNGMNFYFVMEAWICGNQARKCNPPMDYNKIMDRMGIEETDPMESAFCSYSRNTPVTVKVIDKLNGSPVADTSISYSCANSAACFMGFTDANGIAEMNFPNCLNGEIFFQKSGYQEIERIITIEDATDIEIEIEPLKTLNISTKGVDMHKFAIYHYMTDGFTSSDCHGNDPTLLLKDTYFDLNSGDTAIIEFKGTDGNLIKETVLYPEMSNISIASGKYQIRVDYMQNTTIMPSFYPTDDGGMWVGYAGEAPDYDIYEGMWPMGSLSFPIELPDIQNAKVIEIKVPSEYPPEPLEVRDMENRSMTSDHVEFEFHADKNCDGTPEFINYILTQEQLEPLLAPELR